MFARLDVVEKAGTGITRIREAMKNVGLKPPVFEDMGTFFKIILYRPKGGSSDTNIRENVREKSAIKLTKSQNSLFIAIKENPEITTAELVSKIKVVERTIHRTVESLKELGLIRRIGPDKGGYWEILE